MTQSALEMTDAQKCREAFDKHFPTANYVGTVRHDMFVGFAAAWEMSRNERQSEIRVTPDATRYQIGEKAIADCFPNSEDVTGIYHLDFGNLQALVHTAIEIYERDTKRESSEAEQILKLYFEAQKAFDHGDDVDQMMYFGEATERMMAYFHDKANLPTDNLIEDGKSND